MIKWLWLSVLTAALLPATALADDNYVIGKGDVLEINVLNLPALHRRLTVGPDGKIAVPPLGTLVAAGLTADQLQSAMQKQLIEKNVARDPDVVVEIAEYRPVFLDGDVARPGEYGYRADLTVRKAVAKAGGYGPLAQQGVTSLLEGAKAKGDVGSLAIDLARQRLKVLRLNAELANEPELAIAHPIDGSVDPGLFASLAKTEVAQFVADKADRETQREYLQRLLQTAQGEVEFLDHASKDQQDQLSKQMDETARAHDLLQRGMGTVARTEEEERAIGTLQWQNLDVQARLQHANGQIADTTRQLQGYDDQRKMRLVSELRESSADVGKLGEELAAARDRLKYSGGAGAVEESLVHVVIYRIVNGTEQRFDAEPSTALAPGDMVRITVPQTRPVY